MNHLQNITKGRASLIVLIISIIIIYFGINFIKDRKIANDFFNKYSVLIVSGDDIFSYKTILLNGDVIEKTNEEWTNILSVPNSLNYILLTSSYSKGKDIKCGDATIAKVVDKTGGENEWCIHHNGKDRVSTAPSQYYYYSSDEIVYEQCLKGGYYEGVYNNRGFNGCSEMGLFLNDTQIAKTNEQYVTNIFINKRYLQDASSFNYHPSKKLGSKIIYSTLHGTYAYDTLSGKTAQLADNENIKLEDIFLTEDGKTLLVKSADKMFVNTFFGTTEYAGKVYSNVYSADYVDGNFYILRIIEVVKKDTDEIAVYELIRNGKKIENIEIDSGLLSGYSPRAISQFPLCETDTIVCVYEDGHYAYKNRAQVPEVYGYGFYASTMVIDGEWRGEHIPNLIGKSKPIFEDNKLMYIVYADTIDGGLFLADMSKKWNYKSINNDSGKAVTRLLSGHQSKLLNVVKK